MQEKLSYQTNEQFCFYIFKDKKNKANSRSRPTTPLAFFDNLNLLFNLCPTQDVRIKLGDINAGTAYMSFSVEMVFKAEIVL